jgi:hypothetical protein
MPRKRHKPEEVVAKLRQVDVLGPQGPSVALANLTLDKRILKGAASRSRQAPARRRA